MNDIVAMILNKNNRYEGNLIYYYKLIMNAPNAYAPYHNVRHMLHVFWETYDGAIHIGLDKREMRNILIAALMHDYNHAGIKGDDSINIKNAIDALKTYILDEDKPYVNEISSMIECTKFPYEDKIYPINYLILRDADKSQTFSTTWIQAILYNLGKELNISYVEMLKLQEPFLSSLKFDTLWGKNKFEPLIKPRLQLINDMIKIID